ncbi:hypothetical protein NDU88_005675 [Pleurodeles waltl]|uniref:Uncharacterized protein n=1 Tax=Pleurodeles waltl TaxID=8319 RepID=A0AAV7TUN4_PLEWA|nr:hypothetical protein NDU88_005675 [Pleurodeles waltl]
MRCWQTLVQTRTLLENKIDKVINDLTLLHTDHRKLADKTRMLEDTLNDLAPKTSQMDTSLRELVDRVTALEHRAEDVEGRTRRNSIHVVGLLEGAEGADAVSYVEKWVCELVTYIFLLS